MKKDVLDRILDFFTGSLDFNGILVIDLSTEFEVSWPEMREILFGDGADEGDRGVIAVPSGAMVYRISRRAPFDPQRFETEKSDLRRETVHNRRAQHRQAVVNQLKAQQQIEYNASWLDTIEG